MEIKGIMCTMCNVYCTDYVADRVQFLTELKASVQRHSVSKLNLYIGGDLNCVDSLNDRASGALDRNSDALIKSKKDLCLIDVWRYRNPNDKGFTYEDPTRRSYDSRIDLWLVPKLTSNKNIRKAIKKYFDTIDYALQWCKANHLDLNVTKTKEMIHNFRHTHPANQPITIDDKAVEKVKTYKYLGCIIQEDLKWDNHITSQIKKCNKRLFFLRLLNKLKVDSKILCLNYNTKIVKIPSVATYVIGS